ncbi:unnamed protein product [Caenorhabditis sp. 36 PRJEB53466]|nr:unnamed protein product [Caenorhabditis sp. 36 PRJEB53466]
MTECNFLRLSLIPLDKIFADLDVYETVQFSLLSESCRQAVAISRLKGSLALSFWDLKRAWISFSFDGDSRNSFTLKFEIKSSKERRRYFRQNASTKFEVCGVPIAMTENSKGQTFTAYYTQRIDPMKLFHLFARHFLTTFVVTDFEVTTMLIREIDFYNCFIWNYTNKFSNFSIYWPGRKMTRKEMMWLLEDDNIEKLTILADCKPGFQYWRQLKKKSLTVSDGNWLTLDTILNMKTVELIAYEVNLTDDDKVAIVNAWLEGRLNHVKTIAFWESKQRYSIRQFQWREHISDPTLLDLYPADCLTEYYNKESPLHTKWLITLWNPLLEKYAILEEVEHFFGFEVLSCERRHDLD